MLAFELEAGHDLFVGEEGGQAKRTGEESRGGSRGGRRERETGEGRWEGRGTGAGARGFWRRKTRVENRAFLPWLARPGRLCLTMLRVSGGHRGGCPARIVLLGRWERWEWWERVGL